MTSQHDPLPTCNPTITPPLASYRSFPYTPRRALDLIGGIHSFYDARHDKVINQQCDSLLKQSITPKQNIECFIEKKMTHAALNLLSAMNIHQELQLSVALQMTPATGIAASITYSADIDENTRMLCYSTITRTEHVPDRDLQRLANNRQHLANVSGTHVIIFVNYGIDAALLLKLPNNDHQLVSQIDRLLNIICQLLESGKEVQWKKNEESLLRQITHTQVFSNMSRLTECTSIIDFYQIINQLRTQTLEHPPYNYNLCPISHLFSVTNTEQVRYNELLSESRERIQLHICLVLRDMNKLGERVQQAYPLCEKYRRDLHESVMQDWNEIKELYRSELKRLAEWVCKARTSRDNQTKIGQLLVGDVAEIVPMKMNKLSTKLEKRLLCKEKLLEELQSKGFEYRQASNYGLADDDDEKKVTEKLFGHEKNLVILCGSDQLIDENKARWETLCNRAIKHRRVSRNLRLVYVDFSDHSYRLKRFIIAPEAESETKSDGIFNVVLLGESGVGKSTFINALVNYLRFDTFQQAEKSQPIVLLPISFMVTTGHDFEEHQVEYPGLDDGCDERYGEEGQSVTQYCRSYLFTIKDEQQTERKVRLIDTPGFGDVRGADQDEKNMQEIIMFMKSLQRIHAVCMVLKPNVTRLNIAFQRCLRHMVDLLGDDAADHILFCFTNTRSTFYAPGSTSSVLRKALESFTKVKIPFSKQNTFCFDSESFRYLIAKQKSVIFDPEETSQFKETWQRSSTKSKELLKTIWEKNDGYRFYDDQHSIIMARFKINFLLRPMMEAIRNLFRNIILIENHQSKTTVELMPRAITTKNSSYHRCMMKLKKYAGFWIPDDSSESIHDKCSQLRFSSDNSTNIQYSLEYEVKEHQDTPKKEELEAQRGQLFDSCLTFGHFMFVDGPETVTNQIVLHLNMMTHEEHILGDSDEGELNKLLHEKLIPFKTDYDKELHDRKKTQDKSIDFSNIFNCIDTVSNHPMIKCQLDEITKWEQSLIAQREFVVPNEENGKP